ncbi:MAG: hypothetical protein NTW14_04795 [bacterium]|nr:hypothetical protein [bacterium]
MKRSTYLLLLGCIWLFLPVIPSFADQVWIEWTSNTEPDFSHYLVFRGTSPTEQPSILENLLTSVQTPQCRDTTVQSGKTYYYWVASVDHYGNESACSGPLQVLVPAKNSGTSNGGVVAFLIQHLDSNLDSNDPYVDRNLDNDPQIDFNWTPITGSGMTYKIYAITGDNQPELKTESNLTNYQIQSAVNGQKYRLRVDVFDANQQLLAQGFSDYILCDIAQVTMLRPSMPRSMNAE